MSVVNRMLQDIDRRMGAAEGHRVHPDVRSVPASLRARRTRRPVALALGLAAAVAALGLAGVSRQERDAQATAPAAVRVAAAPAQQPPASPAGSEPKPTIPATESEPKPAAAPAGSEPKPMASPAVAAVMVPEEAPREPRRPRPAPVPSPHRTFQLSVKLSDPPARVPGASPAAAVPPRIEPAAAKPAQVRRSEVPVRRVAADETVAAALALWSDGARGDALATLRDALAIAEPRNPQVAGRLARELARLEVAGERPDAALALLRRLESLLAADADAWALRGNAAQRLSLHPEAASAYLAAVRLRPDEGKWMLGAAISLAADGRLDEAHPWVERARERGAVTAPIAAYLQQLGLGPRQ